jgi:hypothetical protein
MTHDETLERLDGLALGDLPQAERAEVEAHLAACAGCRAEAQAVRALLCDAAALPRGIAPPRDLWAGIEARLEPREQGGPPRVDARVIPLFPRPVRNTRWLQAAAAVALIAASSAVTARLVGRPAAAVQGPVAAAALPGVTVQHAAPALSSPAGQQPSAEAGADGQTPIAAPAVRLASSTRSGRDAAPATALAAFRPAEREYLRAADDLQRLLRTRRDRMAPETAATLEKNLGIIDQAIRESRAALLKDPNNRELAQMLSAVYDTKIQTLQRAVQL